MDSPPARRRALIAAQEVPALCAYAASLRAESRRLRAASATLRTLLAAVRAAPRSDPGPRAQ